MNSEEEVKALLLERYSEIYPVPMLITNYDTKEITLFFQNAYFIKPCKTLLSFGILKAGISRCGKSTLIDEIFSTDFTCNHYGTYERRGGASGQGMQHSKTNVHSIGRIDIQMPRNIDSAFADKTNWQIIDASRFCEPQILEYFCWKVNVIFVHVHAHDLIAIPLEKTFEVYQAY